MILSKKEILKAISRGEIKITPFNEKNVGPCSVDLRLGNKFGIFKKTRRIVEISEAASVHEIVRILKVPDDRCFLIKPGELVLGTTYEKISLGKGLCGRIEGRSRFARIGLLVHVSSSLIQPGVDNIQVLEIMNMSPVNIALRPKTKICQVLFESLKGKAEYFGEFKFQKGL